LGNPVKTTSLILAAGRGSRMKGFEGNKTLLPLASGQSPLEGSHPILLHILSNLPHGPKAIVVNHKKEDVINATQSLGLTYCDQPLLNGTGGALLASRGFLEAEDQNQLIITMGDVPFVKDSTYLNLIKGLKYNSLVALGFRAADKKQYGVLEIDEKNVKRIIEWKYWRTYSKEEQKQFQICNSGIYSARKRDLIRYLRILKKNPHMVTKEVGGKMVEVEEFFITDLVELMGENGLKVGYIIAEDENEVMGVDDLSSLKKAQKKFKGS
jgi:bifunctional UDP-N-acetylglucosamine pyrophosphorylase/glucosamine-1-phosphate N-acetyltransferase